MPLFFGDFLAATAFWRGEERGLYLLLLGYEWTTGPLPVEPRVLAESMGYEFKHFERLWKKVGQKFRKTATGLVNDRLEEVRAKSREISAKRAASGAKGGSSPKHPGMQLLKQNGSKSVKQNSSEMLEQSDGGFASGFAKHPIQSNLREEEEASQGEDS